MTDNPLWTEKYRPTRVSDVILPADTKSQFLAMIEKASVPNLLLSGPAGVGKTTVAMAMLDELGHDVYVINGSLKGNIDTLRNEIMDFASSVSFSGSRKTVMIDEADYLNQQSTQPALRHFMEEFSATCGFVLTCNFKNRIIEPLRSRCSVIDFVVPRSEKPTLLVEFFEKAKAVLDAEGVKYDQKTVGLLVNKHFPDFRRALNELQKYASRGSIDSGILSRSGVGDMKSLVEAMQAKDFTKVRKWVGENSDVDSVSFFRKFYDYSSEMFTPDTAPQVILAIGEYQYKASHVADQEINIAAFLVYVMATAQWR